MGDEAPGLYIKQDTAAALMADLVPRADILAPNLWESARLVGVEIASLATAESVAAEARRRGGRWLISSVPSPQGIGVIYVDPDMALFADDARASGQNSERNWRHADAAELPAGWCRGWALKAHRRTRWGRRIW